MSHRGFGGEANLIGKTRGCGETELECGRSPPSPDVRRGLGAGPPRQPRTGPHAGAASRPPPLGTPTPRQPAAWEAGAHVRALLALCPQDPPHSRDSGAWRVPEKRMAPRSPSSNSETRFSRMETNRHRSLQPCCAERGTAILGCSCPQYPAVKAKSRGRAHAEGRPTEKLACFLQGVDLQRKGPGDVTTAWPRLPLP